MGRANHRISSYSVAGRRLTHAKGTADRIGAEPQIPQDIREHNEAIERARLEKLARRKAKA